MEPDCFEFAVQIRSVFDLSFERGGLLRSERSFECAAHIRPARRCAPGVKGIFEAEKPGRGPFARWTLSGREC